MKVTDVKTFIVDCFRTNWVFVKVYTDEGIDGVGEATLEYKEKALKSVSGRGGAYQGIFGREKSAGYRKTLACNLS